VSSSQGIFQAWWWRK